jgi:hypothetical protein
LFFIRVDLKEECRTAQSEIKMSISFLSRMKDGLAANYQNLNMPEGIDPN